jgi:hypothetical protein
MANTELDKTIEELEAEVLAELEEANGADAPKKGAVAPEKGDTQSDGTTKVEKGAKPAEVGDASVKAGKDAKEISSDPAQKGEGKPDPAPKLKEEADEDDEEDKSDDSDDSEDEKEVEEMDHGKMKEAMIKAMKSMKKDDMAELYASYMKASMNKTKDEMYKEMMNGMDKMSKGKMEKLHAAYASGASVDEERDAQVEERLKSVDVKEHVDALLSGDNNLSEDFKTKAATIFETAVKSKIRSEIARLEEEYKSELIEEVADVRTSLTEKVDNYLNYVVEEWMKENELALERGLKGEIAEDFISGLKTLFEDHYIDVPDEKYDVLEAQAEKISKLEEKLEETIQQVVEAKKSNGNLIKEKVMKDVTSDLTDTEVEKFETLAQDVEYTEESVYVEKLNTLKESYFPKQQVVQEDSHDEVETGTAVQDITEGSMAAYMSAIGRTVKSANNK